MTLLTRTRLGLVVAVLVTPLVSGCNHDYGALQKSDGGANCPVGNETCACYPNRTCEIGLICYSNHCVEPGTTGTGGGGTIGPGGASGSAGAVGAGGVIGSGGDVGLGGVTGAGGAVGAAGALGTGGVLGAGGAVGTGGVVGAGGVTGSGGSVPPVANNQIVNGDFSTGSTAPWGITVDSPTGTTLTGVVTNGQFCVSVPTYYAITIGWPSAGSPVAVLKAGTAYELYYQISTTGALYDYEAKVGQATSPYTQVDFDTTVDQPVAGAGLQTFTHTFTPTIAEPVAGLAFNFYVSTPTTVCLDNVALGTPN